ncbi:C6 zinc finger domain protein [Penicillium hordei]|uniref:C6 zinc finger domain protein n=1 Tax=Penicillium hordei TaxID=40994 RepID=A0AAD6ECD2_9EURO|nr:C6 zinc finger domain protein [Penicillium hordei]KAJ5608149.1 C6 zinc finger domain protein [Penicillium hordei]
MLLQPESLQKPHNDSPPGFKFHSSCDTCLKAKIKCSQAKPTCARCLQQGRRCVYSPYRKIGRPSTKNLPLDQLQQPMGRTAGGTARRGLSRRVSLPSPSIENGSRLGNPRHATNQVLHAQESALMPSQNWSDQESTGNFNRLDCGLEGTNWPALGGLLDASMSMLPQTDHELASAAPQLDQVHDLDPNPNQDDLTGYLSPSSLSSRESLASTFPPETDAGSFGISSEFPFSAGYSLGTGPVLSESLNAFPVLSSFSSSASSPATEARGFNLFSAPGDRCTLQCYPVLINILNDMNEFQRKSSGIPLDVLLNLDKRVRKIREMTLGCPCCLVSRAAALTLMLIALVNINLLGLFERSCGSTDGGSGSSMRRGGLSVAPRIALGGSSSVGQDRSRNPLPYTTGHLTLGSIHLDETVKLVFSRRLIRLYLERQLGVVQQLSQLLGRVEGDAASIKVTQDLLRDQLRRLEHFVGFITLTD